MRIFTKYTSQGLTRTTLNRPHTHVTRTTRGRAPPSLFPSHRHSCSQRCETCHVPFVRRARGARLVRLAHPHITQSTRAHPRARYTAWLHGCTPARQWPRLPKLGPRTLHTHTDSTPWSRRLSSGAILGRQAAAIVASIALHVGGGHLTRGAQPATVGGEGCERGGV